MRNNLRQFIQQQGLKQTWVAEQARISAATMSLLVNGKGEPTLRTARKLAKVLGVRIEDIWPEDELSDSGMEL